MADIVFIVDSSGSIRRSNTPAVDNWQLVKSFLIAVVNFLPVEKEKVRIGLVLYSKSAENVFYLNTYNSQELMTMEIENLKYLDGFTNTSGAIRMMQFEQFVRDQGDRPDVQNIAIILTDGESNIDQDKDISDAEIAIQAGITIFGLGVTTSISEQKIKAISSEPRILDANFFLIPNFASLEPAVASFTSAMCSFTGFTPLSTIPTTITTVLLSG